MSDTPYTRTESDLKVENVESRLEKKIGEAESRLENKMDSVLSEVRQMRILMESEFKLIRQESRHEIALLKTDFNWMRWILLATVIAGMLMPMWTHYVESWLR